MLGLICSPADRRSYANLIQAFADKPMELNKIELEDNQCPISTAEHEL